MKYFDGKGNFRAEMLDEEAEQIAKSFVVTFQDRNNNIRVDNKKSLSSAQLRRFYGDFKSLEKKVEKQDFDKVKPLIKMVKSKASYAANPQNQKIPARFKDFLIDNVNSINNRKEFEAFMLHFEAVVGFYYGMGIE
jgi:CRISPR-associated protein Csm2